MAKKYIDAEEITPIMAEYVADVFSRKEHLDDISYGYCMEIADVFRRYAERAKQEQPLEEPEQPTRGYDEAYLNEKIAKASKSWKGVDVDKYMDEVRGRDPVSEELEEAAEKHLNEALYKWSYDDEDGIEQYVYDSFKAGAEWQEKRFPLPEDTLIFRKGVEEGRRLEREDMLKEAVEGEVCILPGNVAYVKEKNNESLKQHLLDNFKAGDKVKIIIVKEDGE